MLNKRTQRRRLFSGLFVLPILAVAGALLGIAAAASADEGPLPGAVAEASRRVLLADGSVATLSILYDPWQTDDDTVFAALLPGVGPASAGTLSAAFASFSRWPEEALPVHLGYNAAGAPTGIDTEAALRFAVTNWSSVAAQRLRFALDGASTRDVGACSAADSRDGANTVAWRSDLPAGTLASTCIITAFDPRTNTGRIVETDMRISTTIRWSTADTTPGDGYDLFTTVLHEFGHVAGLDHSNAAGAVMAPSLSRGKQIRVLSSDDIAGLRSLYSDGTEPPPTPTPAPSPSPTPTSVPRPPLPLRVIVAVVSRN